MKLEQLYQKFRIYPKVTTDTRKLVAGSLFFALKGANFDGNRFAAKALTQGAAYAVVDDPNLPSNDRFIFVEDVLVCLQELANYHRKQFQIPVIGITGSNGKTTTKELTFLVMNSHYPTHSTQGNLNNHIGVPLTLLEMDFKTEVAIIEMGMNHLGEIDALCRIAEPTHGLITNIGKAHMEGVGGIAGVKQAKSELYRYLQETDGTLFVNKDERFLWDLADPNRKKIPYSSLLAKAAHHLYNAELIESSPYVTVAFWDEDKNPLIAHSRLIGAYNFSNIMTAIVVGQYFKVPPRKIKKAIESYVPSENRSQILKKASNTFILDAYNANPSSMKGVLSYFATFDAPKKIAILGDMLEVGKTSQIEHERILNHAQSLGLDQIVLVGKEFSIFRDQALHFDDVKTLRAWFDAQQFEHTAFLLKGSRGIRLEKLIQ